ncbi:hypothetical protein JCM8547_007126 [Rhodosporidiobolus lusitaniae]
MSAKALQYKDAGNLAFRQQNWPLSLAQYSLAIQLDPSVSTFPLNRSAVHLKLNNWAEAEKDATRALDLEGGVGAKALFRRGLARRVQGGAKLEAAKHDFEEAIKQGGGTDVEEELASLVKELESKDKGEKEIEQPAEKAKKTDGAAQKSKATSSTTPSKERLRAALSSKPSAPAPNPASSASTETAPSSISSAAAPAPSNGKSSDLLRPVSTRRLTPSSPSTPSTAPSPASSAPPAPDPPAATLSTSFCTPKNAFAAKKTARAVKEALPFRPSPSSALSPSTVSAPPPPPAAVPHPPPPVSTPPLSTLPPPVPTSLPLPPAQSSSQSIPPPTSPTALESLFLSHPPSSPFLLSAVRSLPTSLPPSPSKTLREWTGDGLTPDLLSSILSVLPSPSPSRSGEEGEDWCYELLRALPSCKRWDSAVLFLGEGEKAVVREWVAEREREVEKVRKAWGL